MSTAIHVQGPAIIKVGSPLQDATHVTGGGSLDTASQLGITEAGADISIQTHVEPVLADTGGPNCPVDLQEMGQTALVELRLVIYDKTVLQSCRARAGATEGTLAAAGTLIGANGYDKRLIISGSDEVWRFYHAYLRGAHSAKLGTRRTIWNLEWFCWALIGTATTAAGAVLYDHTDG